MSNFMKYCITSAFLIGIGLCLYFISTGNLTAREVALMSIVLTALSVMATWIITHIYSQSQHKKAIQEVQESHRANLRTYALKAAEKVNNLSTQLGRLAVYLQDSLDSAEGNRLPEELITKQERIESAIHIINTLKSVNDTTLSDWEGVIGDELDEQRELQAEKEEAVRSLIEKLEDIGESQIDTQMYALDSAEVLTKEIDYLRKELRSIAVNIGLTPARLGKAPEKKSRKFVESHCPECGEVIQYSQKSKPKSIKVIKCNSCSSELISRYDVEKDFILEKRHISLEHITCPSCENTCEVQLDTLPYSSIAVKCNKCEAQITILRTSDGISINTKTLTEKIIESVKESLPPQPWSKGISKTVADKLGLPNNIVSEAIQKLIRRGVFKLQYDGKLYVPEKRVIKKKSRVNETSDS